MSQDSMDEHTDLDVSELADALREHVEVTDRKYHLRTYKACFVGSEACDWMVESGTASDYEQAELLGNVLIDAGVIHHVVKDHDFKNDYLFYRFASDEDHGKRKKRDDGSKVSWLDFVKTGWAFDDVDAENRQPRIPLDEGLDAMSPGAAMGVEPLDPHNIELLDNVHPPAWLNPEPKERYNMVVIGGGTGGLVTAAAVAGLGGKVALIEEHLLGGDCLNFGCVPSKALLSSAKAAANVRKAASFGVRIDGVEDFADRVTVDFDAVMERLRRLRAQIAHHDSAERFSGLGVDVFIGRGVFTGKNTVQVGDKTLSFAKATIATGASPAIPPIPGLREAPYLTNTSIFNLTELPPRLAVIGAGVIGVEMAQAFARLGSHVTVVEQGDTLLPREDADAAQVVCDALLRDGVVFQLGTRVSRVDHESGTFTLTTDQGSLEVDALLVATGRKPNVEGLGLEAAGIDFDKREGVTVSDRLQTSNSDVFAVGDVATRYRFTHAADFMARIVVRNALFFGRDRFSNLLIPWCTYTDPEIAHVGLYAHDLEERGIAFKTFERPFAEVDRAIVDGETEGFVRIHVKAGSDEILGVTIVGPDAGDLIGEATLAMQSGTGLGALASVIHPYPTTAEAIRQTGDLYNRTRLTLTVKKIFRGLLALKR